MATLLELISKLDTNIQIRGCQFEHICKWYLENDPKYRLELKKVWLWKDWPGRWGPDCGIDLVAKAYDGKVWAIQSKAYDKQYPIKKADIDTFLSESSRTEISFRLLISTTNLIGNTAQRTIESQEKKVGLALLSNLEKSEIEWPDSPDELFAKLPKRKEPRPHQVIAINDVIKGFSDSERGQLIMACGTGKTLVSLWIAEKLDCQRTLILLPSLSLLAQTLKEWVTNTSQEFHYLPVCSDDTVRGEDHYTSHTSELGLPVTTDPAEVADFLRKKDNLVVFSTYQSSPVIAKAFAEHSIPSFDLAIADEAHRCAGPVSGIFSTIMDENMIKVKRRLFMTATPRYFTDKAHKEAKELEYEIASMDDDEKFGPSFHRLSFSEAIKKDLLSDYQVVIIGVDNATYKQYAEYETIVTTDGKDATDAKTLASQIALIKAMRIYDLKRVISFHGRIKRAKKFSEQFPDVIAWMPEELRPKGEVWTSYVSGEMSSGKRAMNLDRLRHLEKGERGLLSNARCLGEGVDVPTLDGVAFIDPRHSQIDIVQAVGRAIRKAPNKKTGIIVLPVFISDSQDHESALESSAFKPIWEILKALRAHDDVLAAELDSLRRLLKPGNNTKTSVPDKLIIDLPVTVGEAFAEAFKIKIVKKSSSSWDFWYGLVLQFVEKNGHAVIPTSFVTEDGFKLGNWATAQRSQYNKGTLSNSKERQVALEKLPGWVWDLQEQSWQDGFAHLKKYLQLHGSNIAFFNYVTENGFKLGNWATAQRSQYNKGTLSKDRQVALEKLPGWVWDANEQSWQDGFASLKKYLQLNGSIDMPPFCKLDGFKLGAWVKSQRTAYKNGKLPKEKQVLLEGIEGWRWGTNKKRYKRRTTKDKKMPWDEKLGHLKEYVKQHGHALVARKYVLKNGFKIGAWVQTQRYRYKHGVLRKGKQVALDGIPEWGWEGKNEKEWFEILDRLKKYVEREGHAYVPVDHKTKDGCKLGAWVTHQRGCKRQGKLSEEKQNILNELLGWAWKGKARPTDLTWDESYKLLQEFCEKEGHVRVHLHHKTESGYGLGRWVYTQRKIYKTGKLSKKKQELLEKLPGWLWDAKKARWPRGYEHLCDYVKSNGTSRVPVDYTTKDGYNLGTWVVHQRTAKRKSLLSKERQKNLEKLPDWTWGTKDRRAASQSWYDSLNCLMEYIKKHGNANVPCSYVTKNDFTLGRWVSVQRYLYKKGKLFPERIKALEELNEWSWEATKNNQ